MHVVGTQRRLAELRDDNEIRGRMKWSLKTVRLILMCLFQDLVEQIT